MSRTNTILILSTVFFTACLVWLAFVYYPKLVVEFQTGKYARRFHPVAVVNASGYNFPIQTSAYKIVQSKNFGTYWIYVGGQSLDQYVANQQSARLALKTALSLNDLCNLDVVYVSSEGLQVPGSVNGDDCR